MGLILKREEVEKEILYIVPKCSRVSENMCREKMPDHSEKEFENLGNS